MELGKNISATIKDNKLTLVVDLSKEQGPSKSGKTIIIGTSEGNAKVANGKAGDVIVGVNVYRYAEAKK